MGQFLDQNPIQNVSSESFGGEFLDQKSNKKVPESMTKIFNFIQESGSKSTNPAFQFLSLSQRNPDILPSSLQLAGGAVGGFLGSVVGATLGEVGRQSMEILKGNRDSFDPTLVGAEGLSTAVIEGVTRGTGKVLFGQFQAARRLIENEGKQLKNIKLSLKNIPGAAQIDDILKPLKKGLEGIEVKSGEAASILRKWVLRLETLKKDGVKQLTGGQVAQLEDITGAITRFAKTGASGEAKQQVIKNTFVNNLAKDINRLASSKLDDFAVQQGYKQFPKLSKTVSKLIQQASKPSFRLGFGESSALGLGVGISSNPLTGIATFAAARLADNPTFRGTAFRGIERTGLGRAATLGASEAVRRFIRE